MSLADIGLRAMMDMADFDSAAKEYQSKMSSLETDTDSAAGFMTSAFEGIAIGAAATAAVIGAALVASIAAVGAAAWEAGQVYDEVFDGMMIKTAATGPVLETLQSDFKDVFASVPTDANSASAAINGLYTKLGLTGEALQAVAEPLLEVTRMTGGSIVSNTEALGNVVQKWGIANEDVAGTLDMVFVASQNTGANMGSLLGQLDKFAPIMSTMGFSLVETTAFMASMEKAGVNVSTVMMGMRQASTKFAEAGIPMNQALKDTITQIKAATTDAEALTIATKLFGPRAGIEFSAAVRNGSLAFEDLIPLLEAANGNIMDTSAATQDAAEKMTMMKNKAMTALEPIGTGMLGIATAVLEGLMPSLDDLSETFTTTVMPAIMDALPGIQAFIQDGLEKVASFIQDPLIPTLMEIWKWLSVNLPPAIAFLSDVWSNVLLPAIEAVWDWMSTILIPFLQDVVFPWLQENIPAALQTLSDFWTDVLQPAVQEVWDWMSTTLIPFLTDTLFPWLQENIPAALQTLSDFWNDILLPAITAVWDFLNDYVIPIIEELVTNYIVSFVAGIQQLSDFWNLVLKPALENVWAFIQDNILPIFESARAFMAETLPPVIQTLSDYWNNTLLPAITAVYDFFNDYILPIIQDVIDIFEKVSGIVGTAFAGFWDKVLQPALQIAYDFFKDKVLPIFEDVYNYINDYIGPKVQWLADSVFTPLGNVLTGALKNALEWFKGILEGIKKFFDDFELPWWLTPSSPTPFEMGLVGITDALQTVNKALAQTQIEYAGLSRVAENTSFSPMLGNPALTTAFATSMVNVPGAFSQNVATPIVNESSRNITVNMGGVNVNNGMEMEALEAFIRRTVQDEARRR